MIRNRFFFLRYLTFHFWDIFLLFFCSFAVYWNIFFNSFTFDDAVFLFHWKTIQQVRWHALWLLFVGNVPVGHEGIYRPVRSMFYLFFYHFFGTSLFFYHLYAILLLFFISVLVYGIVFQLVHRRLVALCCSVFFAVYPVHTEAITWVIASMDTLGILFLLLSFFLYLCFRREGCFSWVLYLLSVFAGILSFFTYEVALVLPLLLFMYDFCFVRIESFRNRMLRYLPYIFFAVLYFYLRISVFHIWARSGYPGGTLVSAFFTMMQVMTAYFSVLVLPIHLSSNHVISQGIESMSYGNSDLHALLSQSLFTFPVLTGWMLSIFFLGVAFLLRRAFPLVSFCIFWFFITLFPVLQISPQESIMAERWLFLPSFGFLFLLSLFLCSFSRVRYLWGGLFLCLVFLYGFFTIQRNYQWKNSFTRWRADISINSHENSYAYFALGALYSLQGDKREARISYLRALLIRPHFALARMGLFSLDHPHPRSASWFDYSVTGWSP